MPISTLKCLLNYKENRLQLHLLQLLQKIFTLLALKNGICIPMLDEVVKQNASNLYYILDYSLGFFISSCTLIFPSPNECLKISDKFRHGTESIYWGEINVALPKFHQP